MSVAAPPPTKPRLLGPGLLLAVLTLAGWMLCVLWPRVLVLLGVPSDRLWYMDSYAVLAACDAVRAGLDPFRMNPLDVYSRPHIYSHWWFVLGNLGLSRQSNFLVGSSWALLFLVLGLVLLRPGSFWAAVAGGAALLSPPVLLAVNRANNDLVVFILLAGGLLFLREARVWRLAAFSTLLVLAAGLKLYPIAAAAALLLVRPAKLMVQISAGTALVGIMTLASVWADFRRAAIPTPVEVHTFGAPILFRDLGWTGQAPLLAGAALLALAAGVCLWRGWSVTLEGGARDLRARCAYACGALLLVGCFVAGISFSYRLIHAILLVPWLWQQITTPAARWTAVLLASTLWLDGLYCLASNIFIGPVPEAALLHAQLIWRFATQPIVWAAMALLAGSLLGMLLAAVHDWQKKVA